MNKICSQCGEEKSLSEFYSSKKSGYQSKCKLCKKKYCKVHYEQNKKTYINKAALYKAERTKRLQEIKAEKGCLLCGEKEPVCLDFHHRDFEGTMYQGVSKSKEFGVASKGRDWSWERVLKEIEKCDVVCKNCHAKIHAGLV